jgi:hypothetical protein
LARGGELDMDHRGRRLRHLPHAARRMRSGSTRARRRLACSLGQGARRLYLPQTAQWGRLHRARGVAGATGTGAVHTIIATQNATAMFLPAPQCSHYFHLMCINTWLQNKHTCPICRRKWEFARRVGLPTAGNNRALLRARLSRPACSHRVLSRRPHPLPYSAPKPAPATPGATRTRSAAQALDEEGEEAE